MRALPPLRPLSFHSPGKGRCPQHQCDVNALHGQEGELGNGATHRFKIMKGSNFSLRDAEEICSKQCQPSNPRERVPWVGAGWWAHCPAGHMPFTTEHTACRRSHVRLCGDFRACWALWGSDSKAGAETGGTKAAAELSGGSCPSPAKPGCGTSASQRCTDLK